MFSVVDRKDGTELSLLNTNTGLRCDAYIHVGGRNYMQVISPV